MAGPEKKIDWDKALIETMDRCEEMEKRIGIDGAPCDKCHKVAFTTVIVTTRWCRDCFMALDLKQIVAMTKAHDTYREEME